jgi:hypothetical protein
MHILGKDIIGWVDVSISVAVVGIRDCWRYLMLLLAPFPRCWPHSLGRCLCQCCSSSIAINTACNWVVWKCWLADKVFVGMHSWNSHANRLLAMGAYISSCSKVLMIFSTIVMRSVIGVEFWWFRRRLHQSHSVIIWGVSLGVVT